MSEIPSCYVLFRFLCEHSVLVFNDMQWFEFNCHWMCLYCFGTVDCWLVECLASKKYYSCKWWPLQQLCVLVGFHSFMRHRKCRFVVVCLTANPSCTLYRFCGAPNPKHRFTRTNICCLYVTKLASEMTRSLSTSAVQCSVSVLWSVGF